MARSPLFSSSLPATKLNKNAARRTVESSSQALGKFLPSEVATWQKVGGSTLPDGRYLQAVTFDETRKVAVMFGGLTYRHFHRHVLSATRRHGSGVPQRANGPIARRSRRAQPDARSGAAMVFDSQRNKIVLFGGRAGSGFNYADTWEWDPTSGTWTDTTSSGSRPSARSQHAMVYEKSTGKILLFGGGRSDSTSSDGTGILVSFGDTWEWDPTTRTWTQLQPTASPAARHDFGLVWDSSRNKAVLFGGMEKDTAGVDGSPMQDTWEWDPTAGTWTSEPPKGTNHPLATRTRWPSPGPATRPLSSAVGTSSTGGSLNDLWEWDPVSGSWTLRLDGTQTGIPSRAHVCLPRLRRFEGTARVDSRHHVSSNVLRDRGMGGSIGTAMPSPYGWQGTQGGLGDRSDIVCLPGSLGPIQHAPAAFESCFGIQPGHGEDLRFRRS